MLFVIISGDLYIYCLFLAPWIHEKVKPWVLYFPYSLKYRNFSKLRNFKEYLIKNN